MATRTNQLRYSVAAALVAGALAVGAGCTKKDSADISTLTTPTTAAGSTSAPEPTASPGTTRSPATTSAPATTAPRRTTTTRNSGGIKASQIGGIDPALFSDLPDGAPYGRFTEVTDSTGKISVELPASWQTNVDQRSIEGVDVPSIYAAENLTNYKANESVPGMRFSIYSDALKAKGESWAFQHLADLDHIDQCIDTPQRSLFEDASFKGSAVITTGCGNDGNLVNVHIVATSATGSHNLVAIQVQLVNQADVDALSHVIRTFKLP